MWQVLIEAAGNHTYEFVETLKERNRGMILLLLDKIAESGNKELTTILKAWQMIEFKKVRARIQEVIDELENGEEKPKWFINMRLSHLVQIKNGLPFQRLLAKNLNVMFGVVIVVMLYKL
jgi:hypothetical protein